jgi:hypothetical protein
MPNQGQGNDLREDIIGFGPAQLAASLLLP